MFKNLFENKGDEVKEPESATETHETIKVDSESGVVLTGKEAEEIRKDKLAGQIDYRDLK